MKVLLVILGIAAVTALAVIVAGIILWRRASADAIVQLDPGSLSALPALTQTNPDQLPASVQRYFRHVLGPDHPDISKVRLTQVGHFRIGQLAQTWRPFRALQYYSLEPPGFVWDALIRIAPFLVNVHVRDTYHGGVASMRAALLAVIPIVNAQRDAELNVAALQRYLAEAAWFPTALLSGRVTWQAIDDLTARATLTDAGTKAVLEFRFNERGEIVNVFAPVRFRELNGRYVPTPWLGRFWNYEERHGIRVPLEGEVAWQAGGVSFPYWRGKLADIEYTFDRTRD